MGGYFTSYVQQQKNLGKKSCLLFWGSKQDCKTFNDVVIFPVPTMGVFVFVFAKQEKNTKFPLCIWSNFLHTRELYAIEACADREAVWTQRHNVNPCVSTLSQNMLYSLYSSHSTHSQIDLLTFRLTNFW